MTLPWSAAQVEWLQAMGLDVLRPAASSAPVSPSAVPTTAAIPGVDVPAGLIRAARGIDIAPLVATHGVPRDVGSRRAFWRVLRPLRRAARSS